MEEKMEINAIYNEDCFDIMEQQFEDKSIDLILTDPPYGITNCKWDKKIDLERMFCAFNRIIKDHGVILVTATQPFATDVINANRKYFRYDWVWEKTMAVGFANCRRMPLRAHESILVFYKKLPTYNPQGLIKIEKKIKKKKIETRISLS